MLRDEQEDVNLIEIQHLLPADASILMQALLTAV
jgi:hypothetical protein